MAYLFQKIVMLKRGMKPAHPSTLIRENIEGIRAEGKNITIEGLFTHFSMAKDPNYPTYISPD